MCSTKKTYNHCVINSLINNYPTAVYDSLLGSAVVNKNLVVLENHCIIMRRDHKFMRGKVKIIAGGGAGTEPSEAQYVGRGMLTAAVMGKLFTPPSANEILLAIRELAVDNPEGILLLVKNYLGDRLNFIIAMNQALKENIPVKMLVIQDDVYCHKPSRLGRHGMAGSILVYKIAGEMAEQGKSLEEIIEECEEYVLCKLATAGVTMSSCSFINCRFLKKVLNPDEMLLGLGIYGKGGGSKKIKFSNLQEVVSLLLQEIISVIDANSDLGQDNVTVLVNNFGTLSKLEETVVAKEVSVQLTAMGFKIIKLLVGTFMSSFAPFGFSVSLLKMNSQEIVKCLTAPTSAVGWPGFFAEEVSESFGPDVPISILPSFPDRLFACEDNQDVCSVGPPFSLSNKAVAAMKQIIMFAAEALISCENQLNLIDAEVGDGDIGTSLKKGAEALKKALICDELNLKNPYIFLYELSEICCKFIDGLSGILYCIFFKAAAKTFQTAEEFRPELCCLAFSRAVRAIQCCGKAELGERTMVDALVPAAKSFESALDAGRTIVEAVYLAAMTCEYKSEETKSQAVATHILMNTKPILSYPDAGAHAATIWLRAVIFEGQTSSRGPGIFVWKFLTEEEASYVLRSELISQEIMLFVEKKLGNDDIPVTNLLFETIKFCRKHYKYSPERTSALVGSIYYAHCYCVSSKWRTAAEVYFYFRECILRQSVESPPMSIQIFKPEEVKSALIFFIENYLRNLPLINILHLPQYKLVLNLKKEKQFHHQKYLDKEKGKE